MTDDIYAPGGALARFLRTAKAGSYAADDDVRLRRLDDGGTEAWFEADGFTYRDRWYGEARFGGEEVVWRAGAVVWIMHFVGVTAPAAPAELPHFLKRALRRAPPEAPLRGPALHREGDLVYVNDWRGGLAAFSGAERAFLGGREVLRLEYHGGALSGAAAPG